MRRLLASCWSDSHEEFALNRPFAFSIAARIAATALPALGQPYSADGAIEVQPAAPKVISISWIGADPPHGFGERVASWFEPRPAVELDWAPNLSIPLTDSMSQETSSHVWIDCRFVPLVRIYFAHSVSRQSPKYLVHELALEGNLDEVGLERLAQAIYSSLTALRQGHKQSSWAELARSLSASHSSPNALQPQTQDVPRRPDAPRGSVLHTAAKRSNPVESVKDRGAGSPPHGQPWTWHLAAGTGYGANFRGAEGLGHGPRFWAQVGRERNGLRVAGFASGSYLLPVEPEAANVVVRLTGFKLRLGGVLEFAVAPRTWLTLATGLGMDQIQVQPRTSDDAKLALPGGWEERAVGSALVGLSMPTMIGTVFLVAELDVPLERSHYDLYLANGRRQQLFSSAVWHPGLAVLIRFDQRPF